MTSVVFKSHTRNTDYSFIYRLSHLNECGYKCFFIFFITFLSGCDVLGFNVAGANIRFLYVFSFFMLLFSFWRIYVDKKLLRIFLFYLITVIFSLYNSLNFAKGISSLIWMILNFLFLISLFLSLVKITSITRPQLYSIVIYCYRIQLLIGLLLMVLGVHERIQAFYYEPSYMSISLTIYVSILLKYFFAGKKLYLDFTLILLFLLFSFSANFILVLSFLFFVFLLQNFSVKIIIPLFLVFILAVMYVDFVDDLNTLAIRKIINGDFDFSLLLDRGGNRLSRFLSAKDVFLLNPWFGIGLSSCEDYSLIHGIPNYSQGVSYLNAVGLPVINIYLESLTTTGIVGFSGFCVFWGCFVRKALYNLWSPFSSALLVMLLVLNFESNSLRPYLWLVIGLLLADIWLKKNEKNYI